MHNHRWVVVEAGEPYVYIDRYADHLTDYAVAAFVPQTSDLHKWQPRWNEPLGYRIEIGQNTWFRGIPESMNFGKQWNLLWVQWEAAPVTDTKLGQIRCEERPYDIVGDFKSFLNQNRWSRTPRRSNDCYVTISYGSLLGVARRIFLGNPSSRHRVRFRYTPLVSSLCCFIVGVSQSSRTGIRLVETAQFFSFPVILSSFGWSKWHLSRFSMFRIVKSWPFLWVLVVCSPYIARHCGILTDFRYTVLHN
jgi:hypothetical protein